MLYDDLMMLYDDLIMLDNNVMIVVRRKRNKCTHNTNERNYTKRHQDIYVVWREEVPLHPRVATNH